MRILALILLGSLMFVMLFTASLSDLLKYNVLDFQFVLQPEFEFFKAYWLREDLIVRKIGHFCIFALLFLHIFYLSNHVQRAVMLSLLVALLSEVLQPYFSRDGRMMDVLINSAGVLMMAGITQLWLVLKDEESNMIREEINQTFD
ncbi:VanZ family protein [Filobacillus milosensis]|uniref:VanZ family protein n=1 Tax=Filobacillus milosensis TaxID=94137 RepID=A0A4Y8IKV0_9BACI|nr:VanZ family protein [Filobacillus milosensis]TFB14209.1 VanZ family protein [Filobacillus milosensis]